MPFSAASQPLHAIGKANKANALSTVPRQLILQFPRLYHGFNLQFLFVRSLFNRLMPWHISAGY
jgi:hypothetical protein